ncbi:MAG: PfaD family polyunsaturated fatty acid/polyketide biosynthesis protein, partial [Candidatus Dormibacteria bacterium]
MRVWRAGRCPAVYAAADLVVVAHRAREPIHVVDRASDGLRGLAVGGEVVRATARDDAEAVVVGTVPPLYPEWLGDRAFGAAHGVRFPYVVGEMANGIASTGMVAALAGADMLGFFGAAGLDLSTLERALTELVGTVGDRSNWGVNLIHTPMAPAFEEQVAEVLLRRGVPRISVSAFVGLTPAVVRCAVSGLRTTPTGRITRGAALFAKVSRPEVAEKFMSPAPGELLEVLIRRGQITEEEARLAAHVPVAEDVTVEADSAGHTDRQSLMAVLPAIVDLRDILTRRFGLARRVRVGAAGGLGDPAGVAGAFALGAAYVVTGSVNQMSVEAGVSATAKAMLAQADLADVAMAPSADMFELGVQVQVLRRGTRYAVGARRLYAAYKTHSSLEAIPPPERAALEREVLGCPLDQIWEQTCRYWRDRDPAEIARAASDPKHRMALVFRWYLGQSSQWAVQGDT